MFELLEHLPYVLVTYKDEENQIKNEGARVVTTLYSFILDAPGQLTLDVAENQTLWVSLLPAGMRKIHLKMKMLEWSQQISDCKSMQIFYDAQVHSLRLVLL